MRNAVGEQIDDTLEIDPHSLGSSCILDPYAVLVVLRRIALRGIGT